MLKKLLICCLMLMVIGPMCFAAELDKPVDKKIVGVFLDAPATYANNENIRKLAPAKANELFPKTSFVVLPMDTTQTEMRTYREDNHMIFNQYYSQPLNRADIQKIAKGLNCNYALFITVNNDIPRVSAGLFSTSFKTTVTCDVRLLDVETGKYIVSKQIMKDGSSTAVLAGVPSFDNAYNEALDKAFKELTIDTSTL